MKRYMWGALVIALLNSGCASTSPGQVGAVMGGAAIGSNVGSAIGGLVGDSRHGWHGAYRGSAIGGVVGTLAGVAIGVAMTTPRTPKGEEMEGKVKDLPLPETECVASSLHIRNIRFIDADRNQKINSEEESKVIFEVINVGGEPVYNVVPSVTEVSGMKHLNISPSVLVEQILPGDGIKYTATISAGRRLKTGIATIRVAVCNDAGQEYDHQEFTLETERNRDK